jgi:hypothetical protein
MYGDCGANKEAVILLIISAFYDFARKSTGGVAGLPQTPPVEKFATFDADYFLGAVTPAGSLK